MPTPGKLIMSRLASSKTGTGNTAGPALKLNILSVILFSHLFDKSVLNPRSSVLLNAWTQSLARYFCHCRTRHEALRFNSEPVGPPRNDHTLFPRQSAECGFYHL